MFTFRFRSVVAAALLTTLPLAQSAHAASWKASCEANQKAASSAADEAIMSHHDYNKAVAGAAVGGSCLALLYLTGWLDGGTSALICAVATAGTVVATPAPAAAAVAEEAYRAIRDPNCVK